MNIRTKKTLNIDFDLYEGDIAAIGAMTDIFNDINSLILRETHDYYGFQDFLLHGAYGADILEILDDLENNPKRFTSFLEDFLEDAIH